MNLNQVSLPTTNVDHSAAFYRRLGFTQIVNSPPTYARFECPLGESTFSLHQVAAVPAGARVIVYFECSDLDARYQKLASSGVVFDSVPTDQPWLWREAYLRDPDGNVLCFFSAGKNRRHPPWRLAQSET